MDDLGDVPAPILEAVADRTGARLVLVLGAGCSIERPTNLKPAADYAQEVHDQLIEDNVLTAEDCDDPGDLSNVADAVVAAGYNQSELLRRLPVSQFQQAKPNRGYLRTAALLREGTVDCVITLNYDLAINNALSEVDGSTVVHVIASEDDLYGGVRSSVIFLHRHAFHPLDEWIVRTEQVESSWQNGWEEVVTEIAAAAPVTVFVGLGSPAGVLVSSVERVRERIDTTDFFFIDPNPAESRFLDELGLEEEDCLAAGWSEFTELLSQRLMREYGRSLAEAVDRIRDQDTDTDIEDESARICELISEFDIVDFGRLCAAWLTDEFSFRTWRESEPEWLGVAIAAIAILAKNGEADITLDSNGIVKLVVGTRTRFIGVVHGRSSKTWVEARSLIESRWDYSGLQVKERPEFFVFDSLRGRDPDDVATPISLIEDEDTESLISGDRNYKLVAATDILQESETE